MSVSTIPAGTLHACHHRLESPLLRPGPPPGRFDVTQQWASRQGKISSFSLGRLTPSMNGWAITIIAVGRAYVEEIEWNCVHSVD